jgi:hypothetical protein
MNQQINRQNNKQYTYTKAYRTQPSTCHSYLTIRLSKCAAVNLYNIHRILSNSRELQIPDNSQVSTKILKSQIGLSMRIIRINK